MGNFVGITSCTVETIDKAGKLHDLVITSIIGINGQVLSNLGGKDWHEVRPPELRGEIIGVCKDCGQAIYEEDEWTFSTAGKGWTAHAAEEDCKK